MKKIVLLCSAAAICFAASAQNRLAKPTKVAPPASHEKKLVIANENQPRATQGSPNMSVARHGNQGGGNTSQAITWLGTAANALTAIRTHNFVWADPNLQTIV